MNRISIGPKGREKTIMVIDESGEKIKKSIMIRDLEKLIHKEIPKSREEYKAQQEEQEDIELE